MWTWTLILGAGQGDGSFGQLAYIIALLVLAALGALAEKIKQKQEASKRQHGPGPTEPPGPPTMRERPDVTRRYDSPVPSQPIPRMPGPKVPVGRPVPPAAPPPRRPKKVRPPAPLEPEIARAAPAGERVTTLEVGTLTRELPRTAGAGAVAPKLAPEPMHVKPTTGPAPAAAAAALKPGATEPAAALIGPVSQLASGDLRRAFVWSEILQPPLALRDEPRWWSSGED
jgi:hypothetical protein